MHCVAVEGSCRPFCPYIFFDFIIPIFIALFMCIEHPAMSFCDIDDLAEVISCMAIVLFSPSGIFIIMSSAFAILASEQPIIFDLADAGTAAIVTAATRAAQANLEIMFVPRIKLGNIAHYGTFQLKLGSFAKLTFCRRDMGSDEQSIFVSDTAGG